MVIDPCHILYITVFVVPRKPFEEFHFWRSHVLDCLLASLNFMHIYA